MFTKLLLSTALLSLAEFHAPAPELVGSQWINTPGGKPITLASRLGKVTVVEFWTFACINCRHNLPSYARWHTQFAAKDVAIIGIHTPETDAERDPATVARHVQELGIQYPVLLDNDYKNWDRWRQQYWPVVYVIDKRGRTDGHCAAWRSARAAPCRPNCSARWSNHSSSLRAQSRKIAALLRFPKPTSEP